MGVQFADDADDTGLTPQRQVPAMHVIRVCMVRLAGGVCLFIFEVLTISHLGAMMGGTSRHLPFFFAIMPHGCFLL